MGCVLIYDPEFMSFVSCSILFHNLLTGKAPTLISCRCESIYNTARSLLVLRPTPLACKLHERLMSANLGKLFSPNLLHITRSCNATTCCETLFHPFSFSCELCVAGWSGRANASCVMMCSLGGLRVRIRVDSLLHSNGGMLVCGRRLLSHTFWLFKEMCYLITSSRRTWDQIDVLSGDAHLLMRTNSNYLPGTFTFMWSIASICSQKESFKGDVWRACALWMLTDAL